MLIELDCRAIIRFFVCYVPVGRLTVVVVGGGVVEFVPTSNLLLTIICQSFVLLLVLHLLGSVDYLFVYNPLCNCAMHF